MTAHKDTPRLVVTAGVFVLFGWVLWHNSDNQMLIGAMIGSLGTAVTYWLGSSKGSSDKTDQIGDLNDQASGKKDDPLHVTGEGEDLGVGDGPRP